MRGRIRPECGTKRVGSRFGKSVFCEHPSRPDFVMREEHLIPALEKRRSQAATFAWGLHCPFRSLPYLPFSRPLSSDIDFDLTSLIPKRHKPPQPPQHSAHPTTFASRRKGNQETAAPEVSGCVRLCAVASALPKGVVCLMRKNSDGILFSYDADLNFTARRRGGCRIIGEIRARKLARDSSPRFASACDFPMLEQPWRSIRNEVAR